MKRGLLGIGLSVGMLLAPAMGQKSPLADDLYKIYSTIYKQRMTQFHPELKFSEYKEGADRATFEWSAEFTQPNRNGEGRFTIAMIELATLTVKDDALSQLESILSLGRLDGVDATINAERSITLRNEVDGAVLYHFPLVESLQIRGEIDRDNWRYQEEGVADQQATPLVLRGLDRGKLQFDLFTQSDQHQFNVGFNGLRWQEGEYRIQNLSVEFQEGGAQGRHQLRADEFVHRRFKDYEVNESSANMSARRVHYNQGEQSYHIESIGYGYEMDNERKDRFRLGASAQIKGLSVTDPRCPDHRCQLGDFKLASSLAPLAKGRVSELEERVAELQQFLRADNLHSLTGYPLKEEWQRLLTLMGETLIDETQLSITLSGSHTNQGRITLMVQPSLLLKKLLEEEDSFEQLHLFCGDEGFCLSDLVEQFKLKIMITDDYFYDLATLYFMSKDVTLSKADAQRQSRKIIRNIIIADLLLADGAVDIFARSGNSTEIDLEYSNGEWFINGSALPLEQLLKLTF